VFFGLLFKGLDYCLKVWTIVFLLIFKSGRIKNTPAREVITCRSVPGYPDGKQMSISDLKLLRVRAVTVVQLDIGVVGGTAVIDVQAFAAIYIGPE